MRVERLRLLDLGECVGVAAFAVEHLAVEVVGASIVRMRLQDFGQAGIGPLPVALGHGGFDLLHARHGERHAAREGERSEGDTGSGEKLFHLAGRAD